MKDKLLNTLLELGLSDKEAKVYLACLSLGPTSVLKIARITGLKRPGVYPVIERLQIQGLMFGQVKGFKTLFSAENPEKLELILETKKAKFKSLMPDFSKLYNLQGQHAVLKQYEGLSAVKNVYEELLSKIKPHDEYLIMADQANWLNLDKDYFTDFTRRRAKLPIRIKALQVRSKESEWFKKYEKNFNMEIRFLPEKAAFNTNLVVTPQMLVIHQITPPVSAIVIENKAAIEMQKQMFNIIWDSLG